MCKNTTNCKTLFNERSACWSLGESILELVTDQTAGPCEWGPVKHGEFTSFIIFLSVSD